jgi:hypothetical protein
LEDQIEPDLHEIGEFAGHFWQLWSWFEHFHTDNGQSQARRWDKCESRDRKSPITNDPKTRWLNGSISSLLLLKALVSSYTGFVGSVLLHGK